MKKQERKKERFPVGGKKWGKSVTKKNYWQQVITKREKAGCFGIAMIIVIFTGWLFYQSIWSAVIVIPYGIWIYRSLISDRIERKKSKFLLQFKDMTEAVSQALNVGYSAENAFKQALEEMRLFYPDNSLMGNEMEYIVRKLRLRIPLEQILDEFATKVELEDVKNFAVVFGTAKKSGGDMIAIIQNTAVQISEKIDVKQEIDIIMAAKKYEFRIMCVVPYIMILYMQFSFPEFMSVLYGNVFGIGVMTVCLGIYVGACWLGLRLIKIDV